MTVSDHQNGWPVSAMSDGGDAGRSRGGVDYTPNRRAGAVGSSARHTALVRVLKLVSVAGSLLAVTIIALVAVFNPFRHLPTAVSLTSVGVAGTKITMDQPKLSGLQQGGGPYLIKAKTGIQDILKPNVMDLLGVDSLVGMSDGTSTHVTSTNGQYNSQADTMLLSGDVKIENTSGYKLNLQSAAIDFKNGVLQSRQRLRVDINGGEVDADGIAISNNGHLIRFDGNVKSRFEPDDDEPTVQAQAETP